MKFNSVDGTRIPTRSTVGSCGYDFYMPKTVHIPPFASVEFKTGIQVDLDPGYVLMLFPRSSVGKRGLVITNTVGVIDSDYKDEIHAFITNQSHVHQTLKIDERFMQGVVLKYHLLDEENVEGVRVGGIGSTGK